MSEKIIHFPPASLFNVSVNFPRSAIPTFSLYAPRMYPTFPSVAYATARKDNGPPDPR